MTSKGFWLPAAGALALASAQAHAQSGPAGDTPSAPDTLSTGGINDIVVTARKRAESIQDVPVSITAVTGESLTQRGVTNLQDIGAAVPGLKPQPHPSSSSIVQFQLRGQTAGDTLLTVDQAVGVYLDGIYVARPRGLSGAFFDIERIEVVKGPQGTLYGRNTTGGAVNLNTRGADFDGTHGFVGGDIGEYNLHAVRGAVNIPLVDDMLALRLAYQGTFRDGFGRSATTGQDLGQDRNQHMMRASLLFEPTETLRFTGKAEYYRSRENNTLYAPVYFNPQGGTAIQAAVELGGGPFLGAASFANPVFLQAYGRALARLTALTTAARADPYTSYTQVLQQDDNDVVTLGGRLEFDLTDSVTLTSLTGWRYLKSDQGFDLDATEFQGLEVGFGTPGGYPLSSGTPGSLSPNFTFPSPPEQEDRFFSQELNLGGSAIDDRLTWLVGAYYSRERGRDVQPSRVLPALTGIAFVNDGYKIRNDSYSFFTQNDFRITDQLSITGGVRYTKELKGLVSRVATFNPATGVFTCGSGAEVAPGVPVTTTDVERAPCDRGYRKNFDGISYLGSVNFKPNNDILIFAKIARGFRGGAFQLRAPTAPPAGPETATEMELGIKADLFDRKVRANISGYTTKYANKQESIIITLPAGNLATVIQNAANARIKGFEGEFTFRPVDGLTLGANVSYIEGKYNEFLNALPISGGTPVDASGERFSLPPWSYSLTGRYEFDVGVGTLGVQSDWSWTAGARPPARLVNPGIPADVINDTVANVNGGSYANGRRSLGLLNGRIDLKLADRDVSFALWATNLLDKKYGYSGIDPSSAGVFATITGAPRMIGGTVRVGFGKE